MTTGAPSSTVLRPPVAGRPGDRRGGPVPDSPGRGAKPAPPARARRQGRDLLERSGHRRARRRWRPARVALISLALPRGALSSSSPPTSSTGGSAGPHEQRRRRHRRWRRRRPRQPRGGSAGPPPGHGRPPLARRGWRDPRRGAGPLRDGDGVVHDTADDADSSSPDRAPGRQCRTFRCSPSPVPG